MKHTSKTNVLLAFHQQSNSLVTSHVAIKYDFSINWNGFNYDSHILTDVQQNCTSRIGCGCSTWSSTKPFRLRSPEVSHAALKAVSKFTRNKLLQVLEVGFFKLPLFFHFRSKSLVLEHKHFKLPQPHALSDPMDLMTTTPREVVDRQVEEEGVGSVLLVD